MSAPVKRRADYKARPRIKAAALYIGGWTIQEIADELGVAYSRAHVYLEQMGVKMRPQGRPRERRSTDAPGLHRDKRRRKGPLDF